MIGKNQFLKIIKNQFGRVVFVRLDFVYNDLSLLFNLPLRESGMEYNIRQQLKSTPEMRLSPAFAG